MIKHMLEHRNPKNMPQQYINTIIQNPCMGCPGYCCSDNVINVCGYDVWLIAKNLHIKPSDFVAFAGFNEESPYNFKLDSSGNSYCLALYMKELHNGSRRCIFSIDLPGQLRCGIYPFRPIGCHAYPIAFLGEEVMVKPWALCPEGNWTHNRLDKAFWREELGRHDMEFSIYAFMLAAWNMAAQRRQPGVLDFQPFLTFLMDCYSCLDALRNEIPQELWANIHRQWRWYTSRELNPLFMSTNEMKYPDYWEGWLAGIRRTVLTTINHIKPGIIEQAAECR
jgi:Fe-S-cluster containining protein